jgi:hypothetical protein
MQDRDSKMQPRDCSHACTTGQEPRRLLAGRVPSSRETRAHIRREGSGRLEPESPNCAQGYALSKGAPTTDPAVPRVEPQSSTDSVLITSLDGRVGMAVRRRMRWSASD